MSRKEIIIFPGIEEISEYLARLIRDKITPAGDGKPLNIALSGGSTPKQIFDILGIRHRQRIKWNRIRFFQVDERCVPPDSPESNYQMIRVHLLDRLNFPEDHFYRIRGEKEHQEEALRYGKTMVENLPMPGKWPVFDMILLGLGEDGHTASLFPGDTHGLHSKKCCEVAVHPQTGQKRITLTLPLLNRAKQLVFIVTGKAKSEIIAEIIQNPDNRRLPASMVSPGKGSLIWLLDADAASELNTGHLLLKQDNLGCC